MVTTRRPDTSSTELLERYLQAVRRYLPRAQQSDIVEELSDNIQSQMEEKESELGRPLSFDEQSDILKAYGRPILVAGRYRTQQTLIGPALLPYYWQTLKFALACVLIAGIAVTGITAVATRDPVTALAQAWANIWGTIFFVIGVATVAFGALERFRPDGLDAWDPRSLPPVINDRQVPRYQSIIELFFNCILVLWLLGVPWIRYAVGYSLLGPGIAYIASLPFKLGPWWHQYSLALIATSLIQIALNGITLIRPDWVRLRAAVMVATNSFLFVVVCSSLWARSYVVMATNSTVHTRQIDDVLHVLNSTAFGVLALFGLICIGTIVDNIRRLPRQSVPSRTVV
jgi:hypothetical protein